MSTRREFLIGLPALAAGCSTIFASRDWDLPASYAKEIEGELYAAVSYLKSVDGYKYDDKKAALRVTLVPGGRKINGYWCWQEPNLYGTMWIAGLCGKTANKNKMYIKLGVHPSNGREINHLATRHEAGHYWLVSNRGIWDHRPEYAKGFANWKDPGTRYFFGRDASNESVVEIADGFEV